MSSEVEIRALVPNATAAEDALRDAGFACTAAFEQLDMMYDRPDGALFRSGQKIRIRVEGNHAELTYKGAFQGDASASRRTEVNVLIQPKDTGSLSELLEALGYPLLFQVRKARNVFRAGAVTATLDDWPIIGPMLELEGDEADIKEVAEATFPGIEFANYRLKTLFEKVCAERGLSLAELQKEYEGRSGFKLGNLGFLLQ